MARNKNFELSAAQVAAARKAASKLWERHVEASVTVEYTKRDGAAAVLVGPIQDFVGKGSTEAVVIKTDKGYRSANLWAIKSVR